MAQSDTLTMTQISESYFQSEKFSQNQEQDTQYGLYVRIWNTVSFCDTLIRDFFICQNHTLCSIVLL